MLYTLTAVTESLGCDSMSTIHHLSDTESGELRWQGVPVSAYGSENGDADRATRQVLIGIDENSPNFNMRYFAVQPGGHTSLDQHPHDHGVYVLHGRARLRLGNDEYELRSGDVVYISGNEIHQFFTRGDEPFGFLCIVPARR
jgi:quercetin dioxygenase-like cupin family protein